MSWFDISLRVTAYPVWILIALVMLRILLHLIWSASSAYSLTAWSYRCCKVHGFAKTPMPPWVYMPKEFFCQWADFIGSKPGQITVSHRDGEWRGIRRWRINPKDASQ